MSNSRLIRGDVLTPREQLIAAVATAGGDDELARERACAVVSALDEYLAEGPDRAAPLFYRIMWAPEDIITERDAAVARAEKAEQELRELKAKFSAIESQPETPVREDA